MIRITLFLLFTFIINNTLKAQAFKTADDSLAYSLGVLVGNNLKSEGFSELDVKIIAEGLEDALKSKPTKLTLEQCNAFFKENSANRKMKANESTKVAGEQYLANNKKRPGVITLDNGLQYEILKEGNGPKPKASDKVNVHYHGTLIDGYIFDSSVDRGEPITFALNQVIKGWTEILQLMPVGSKWKVYIPYDLAYGDRGAGQSIKPYSMLIFEIELLGIE